jgi:hypothetical protein
MIGRYGFYLTWVSILKIFPLNLALIHLVLIQVRIDDQNFNQDTLKISNRDNGVIPDDT